LASRVRPSHRLGCSRRHHRHIRSTIPVRGRGSIRAWRKATELDQRSDQYTPCPAKRGGGVEDPVTGFIRYNRSLGHSTPQLHGRYWRKQSDLATRIRVVLRWLASRQFCHQIDKRITERTGWGWRWQNSQSLGISERVIGLTLSIRPMCVQHARNRLARRWRRSPHAHQDRRPTVAARLAEGDVSDGLHRD
jgi:hypothetical protein